MLTADVILLLAFFVITFVLLLSIARDTNIARRAAQETAALLRKLAEAQAPGSTKDVPVTTEEEPRPSRAAPAPAPAPAKAAPAAAAAAKDDDKKE